MSRARSSTAGRDDERVPAQPRGDRAAFAHGWFHSGDVGRFGDDGVLWFADRYKDVIKTGGENADPPLPAHPPLLRAGRPRAPGHAPLRSLHQRSAGGGDPHRELEPAGPQGGAVRHAALTRRARRPSRRPPGEDARERRAIEKPWREEWSGRCGTPAWSRRGSSASSPPIADSSSPCSASSPSWSGSTQAHRSGHRPRADQETLVAARPAQPSRAAPPPETPEAGGRAHRGDRRSLASRVTPPG